MRKPTKVQVFEAVRDCIQEFEEWLELPDSTVVLDPPTYKFVMEFKELKRRLLSKYL